MLDFYNFLSWLSGTFDEEPGNYGWFHLMFVGIVVVATFLVCHFFKDAKDKTYRRIVLITWLVIVLFEVYKEIIFSFHINEEDILMVCLPISTLLHPSLRPSAHRLPSG